MRRSPAWRFFIVAVLVLLMFIPLLLVGQMIDERADYNRSTRNELGQEWGGRQSLRGPYMIVPVEETLVERKRVQVTDAATGQPVAGPDGKAVFEVRQTTSTRQQSVYVFPRSFDVTVDSRIQERRKGIFRVPVYTSDIAVDFDFDLSGVPAHADVSADETAPGRAQGHAVADIAVGQQAVTRRVLKWEAAELRVRIENIVGLRGAPTLNRDGTPLKVEPMPSNQLDGFRIRTGDPRGGQAFHLDLQINGAEQLQIDAVGDPTTVVMTGDWPHPNFAFAYLPDTYEVTDQGYRAEWKIPRLARGLPEVADSYENSRFLGVRLYQPNDFYQQSYRAARYGILFIALSFLTIYLIEGQTRTPTHPVQYILVGLAQSVFFLMLLAFAEQIGFGPAYLASAGPTVLLITLFGAVALKLGRRTLVLGALLAALYGVLYLILRSTDYALLAGSLLLFAAIAGTMFATRDQDWYQAPAETGRRGRFWSGRPQAPQPGPPATAATGAQDPGT